jgi:hypothetical protein
MNDHKPVSEAKDLRHKDQPPGDFKHLRGQFMTDQQLWEKTKAEDDCQKMDEILVEWSRMYGGKPGWRES